MQPDDSARIGHIFEAADDIAKFIVGKSESDLASDKMLLLALTRCVEIIGEAATKMSQETKASVPEIPWGAIAGMRNRLVHAYFDVDRHVLWDTATKNVPQLVRMLRARGY